MLKILICVKQVPDVDLVKMDPETGNLVRDGVPTMLNPLDSFALSAALSVKEKYGAEITAITMGPPMAESVLRECLSFGADRAVLITGRAFGGADTLSTSYPIAMAAKSLDKFDLIFAGTESLDGATGQMGAQLAERFDASQITGCLEIMDVDEKDRCVTAKRELEHGVMTVRATLPCLITPEKSGYPTRLPSLKGKLAARKAPITVLTENDIPDLDMELIGVPGSGTVVPKIYPPVLPEPGQLLDMGSDDANVTGLIEILAGNGMV